jgi:iron complex outermembrane receptor protein
MMRIITYLFLCFLLPFSAFAQQLKGKVFDAYSQTPLEGASVKLSDATGIITDKKGEFVLGCNGATKITISYAGYATYTGSIKDCNQRLNIGLTPTNSSLNEVRISDAKPGRNTVLNQPQSIGILSRQELTRSEGLFLENTINLVPGVRMEKRTATGGQRLVIRGYGNSTNFNGTGIKTYFNGIPITDAEGATIFDDIDFSTLGKVEIIKGPASSLYGTGIGGVVKMFTLKPEPNTTKIIEEVMAGSYGLWNSNTRLETANDRSSIVVNYGHQNYDGYRVHSAAKKDFVSFLGDFKSSEKESFSVFGNYNNSYNGLAGQLDSVSFFNKRNVGEQAYLGNNGHTAYESFRSGFTNNYTFSKHVNNVSSAYFTNYKLNQSAAPSLTSNIVGNYGGRTEFNLNFPGEKISVDGTVGGEYQKSSSFRKTNAYANSVLGALTTDLEVATMQYSLFTEWNVHLPENFTLIAGAGSSSIEYGLTDKLTNTGNPTHRDQSGYKVFKPVITPRIALQKMFNQSINVYATVSQGYSPPTSTTVVIPTTGQVITDLKPEKGTLYEFGSKGSLLNKKFSYQLALFNMNVTDKLTTQGVTNAAGTVLYSYAVNSGKQRNKGLEISLNYSLLNDDSKTVSSIRPFINYTYSDFTYVDFKSDNNNNARTINYSGKPVVGVPPHNFNAGVDIGLKQGLYLHTTYQYVDAMSLSYDNAHHAPSFSLLNAKIGWRKGLGQHYQLDVFAGSNNLTKSLYYNMVFLNSYSATAPNPNIYLPAAYNATFYGGVNFNYKF